MELHAVFGIKNEDDKIVKAAVVGLIYHLGRHNDFVDELIDAGLPEKTGETSESEDEINLADELTRTRTSQYYTYPGSLTTPPCSEIVTWILTDWMSQKPVTPKPDDTTVQAIRALRFIANPEFRFFEF